MTTVASRAIARRYRRRTERTELHTLQLTERDRWLLESIAKMRFLSTSQLVRLGFGASRSAVNKRLRRLFDAGLVRAWVRCLESENVYSLTAAGRLTLPTDDGSHVTVPRGLDRDLDHTLAINDVRIALATTLPAIHADLVSWLSDWDLRPRRSARLVPDANFTVRWSNGREIAFHLEVDRNTKSASALLRKLFGYRAMTYRHDDALGSGDYVILVVAHDPAWLARYRLHVAHAALSLPVWFATLADVVAHGATDVIWRTADSDEPHGLRTLSSLPNGSEDVPHKSAAAVAAYGIPGARVPYAESAR
jgi:DNA-binding transcriptional ArsR family regulator